MTQPASHPFHLSNLVSPALDGIIRALSDRGGQSEAQRLARSDAALTVILSFQPCDVIDLTLAGQTVLFNELVADSAKDVLRGMATTDKPRNLSNLISLGRLMQGNLDRLQKRGSQPFRTEIIAEEAEDREEPEAETPAADLAEQPSSISHAESLPAGSVDAGEASDPAASMGKELVSATAEAETSWLDEPYDEWVMETPADLAARGAPLQAQPDAIPRRAPANDPRDGRPDARPGCDEPDHRAVTSPALRMADGAAGD